MFKFLRRYSKWILAVGGTLLLITFLVPYAFQGIGQMAATHGASWGTVGPDNEEVSVYDYTVMQREMQIVEFLNPNKVIARIQLDAQQTVPHWYLLSKFAAEAGLVGAPDEAISLLPDPQAETLAAIQQRFGEPREFVLETLAKYRGVFRLVTLFSNAGHFSDRRLRQEAKKLFHSATAKFVVMPASAAHTEYEPSDAEITAQFEKYADLMPGEGELGFGYKLPNRVKLEWLTVSAEDVRSMIESSPAFNEIALRKHWRMNPQARFPEVVDGGEVPQVVRDDLATVLFSQKMDEITRTATDFLRSSTRGLSRSGAYFVLPEDWGSIKPRLQDLALALQEEFGLPLPTYESVGDEWLSAQDIAAMSEGLGAATTDRFGPQPLSLSAIVAQLKEFGEPHDAIVQEDVTGPPMRHADGSLYFFRVTASDKSRKATGIDEVRDEVVTDLKRVADYESLRAEMTALEDTARTDGLLSLLLADTRAEAFPAQQVSQASVQSLMIQAQLGLPLNAVATSLPIIGRNEGATDAIITRAMALPLLAVSDLAPSQKVFALPVDDELSVLVVEITQNMPLTRETYLQAVDVGVVHALLFNRELDQGQAIRDAFSYESLSERFNFELTRSDEEEDADADTAATE